MSPTPRRIGTGGSRESEAKAIVNEAVRIARLQGANAPPLVPGYDDASFMLALRSFASGGAAGGGRGRLNFGEHMLGGGYDGSTDVLIKTDATHEMKVKRIVSRDENGYTAVMKLILGDTGSIGDTGAGSLDIWPTAPGGHVRIQKHDFSATNVDFDDDGSMALRNNLTLKNLVASENITADGGIGLFGNPPGGQVSAPAAAGSTYGTTEQTLINDLRQRLLDIGVYV